MEADRCYYEMTPQGLVRKPYKICDKCDRIIDVKCIICNKDTCTSCNNNKALYRKYSKGDNFICDDANCAVVQQNMINLVYDPSSV